MANLAAVIGGSGLYTLADDCEVVRRENLGTEFGKTSAEIEYCDWQGRAFLFLPRHGIDHLIPPHRVNYRANLKALSELGTTHIFALNTVGGISPQQGPGTIALPDQIIDYTSGREHTLYDGSTGQLQHIDFTFPYSRLLRELVISSAQEMQIDLVSSATYGCSNGPRLETSAEIQKMKSDGCDVIGMTGMPEAALARELDIEYVSITLAVNWCAGIDQEKIEMAQIMQRLKQGMQPLKRLIFACLQASILREGDNVK